MTQKMTKTKKTMMMIVRREMRWLVVVGDEGEDKLKSLRKISHSAVRREL